MTLFQVIEDSPPPTKRNKVMTSTKYILIIMGLIAFIFMRECKYAERYQNWTRYESELQQQIADLTAVCEYDFE